MIIYFLSGTFARFPRHSTLQHLIKVLHERCLFLAVYVSFCKVRKQMEYNMDIIILIIIIIIVIIIIIIIIIRESGVV